MNKAGAAYGTGYCDAQCPHDINQAKSVFGDFDDHAKKGSLKAMGVALKAGVVLTIP
ncbi:unnamed protein product [Aphanomyces euteiches]